MDSSLSFLPGRTRGSYTALHVMLIWRFFCMSMIWFRKVHIVVQLELDDCIVYVPWYGSGVLMSGVSRHAANHQLAITRCLLVTLTKCHCRELIKGRKTEVEAQHYSFLRQLTGLKAHQAVLELGWSLLCHINQLLGKRGMPARELQYEDAKTSRAVTGNKRKQGRAGPKAACPENSIELENILNCGKASASGDADLDLLKKEIAPVLVGTIIAMLLAIADSSLSEATWRLGLRLSRASVAVEVWIE